MNSAILISPGVMEINPKAPMPEPGPGEIIVKVKAALTCGTDIKAYKHGHEKINLPSPLGHEFSGDVHSLGEGVIGFPEGTPVMAVHTVPCGECYYCENGSENLCSATMDNKILGAYSEYIKLPARIVERHLYKKPEGLEYAEAAMLEPLACVLHGGDVLKCTDYENVLILGAGPVGLLHLMHQKSLGKKVIVSGRGEARLKAVEQLGADVIVDASYDEMAWSVTEATNGVGADVVIEAAGSKEAWESAPGLVRKGGTVLFFGGCAPDTKVSFSASRLHYDEISILGAFHYTHANVEEAVNILEDGRLDVKQLISGEYPLEDLQSAFDALIEGRGVKYAIIP